MLHPQEVAVEAVVLHPDPETPEVLVVEAASLMAVVRHMLAALVFQGKEMLAGMGNVLLVEVVVEKLLPVKTLTRVVLT